LVRSSKPPRPGSHIYFGNELSAIVLDGGGGVYRLAFSFDGDFSRVLEKTGEVPLPPYIKRGTSTSEAAADREAYQTVYARKNGAVAAPTAGLHFSESVLEALERKGVMIVPITLHVGYGTFLPVRVSDIRVHTMHPEWYEISQVAADTVSTAKADGRPVIAVGTTSVRSLEYCADPSGGIRAGSGQCDLFIYPGYRFNVVDGLITNFHLPKSTLLMLVSAFAERDFVLKAYREAVRHRYRFYSYGDGMFIRR
jgi:S-adenosylmethionine:tRNA ribosyltransferase-isomerase